VREAQIKYLGQERECKSSLQGLEKAPTVEGVGRKESQAVEPAKIPY